MDMNNLSIIGRITRELEMKTIGQTNILNFSIAVGMFKKDDTSFFDVTAFGKTAELINQYLSKGSQIGITGSIRQESWEKDGQKRSRVVINAQNVQFIGGKNESNSGNNGNNPSADSNGGSANDSDIPF